MSKDDGLDKERIHRNVFYSFCLRHGDLRVQRQRVGGFGERRNDDGDLLRGAKRGECSGEG